MARTEPILLDSGLLLRERYRLQSRIGRGGIGEVWKAWDEETGSAAACKILRDDVRDIRTAVAFLKREVLVSRRLRHSCIVKAHTFYDDPIQFVTMDFIDGANLSRMLINRRQPFEPEEIARWLTGVCAALDYAHLQGVLHRDIKPENILIDHAGQPHLVDFGLADLELDDETLPERSEVRGTLAYMSPEVLLHGEANERSDQYSLAATVYEMLSGTPPFQAGEVVAQIAVKPPAPIPRLSEGVNRTLLRALTKSPDRRFSTCGDFFLAFRTAASGKAGSGGWLPAGDVTDPSRETAVLGGFEVATRRTRLGKMLLETGAIDQEQLANALIRQQAEGSKLGEALIALGYLREDALAKTLSLQLQVPELTEITVMDADLVHRVGVDKLLDFRALPLNRSPYGIVVAMADPLDMAALNALEQTLGETIEPVVSTYSEIARALGALR